MLAAGGRRVAGCRRVAGAVEVGDERRDGFVGGASGLLCWRETEDAAAAAAFARCESSAFRRLASPLSLSLLLILLSLKLAFAESPGGSCWVDETLVENRPLLAGMLVAFGEEGLAGGVPEASGKQNMAQSVLSYCSKGSDDEASKQISLQVM